MVNFNILRIIAKLKIFDSIINICYTKKRWQGVTLMYKSINKKGYIVSQILVGFTFSNIILFIFMTLLKINTKSVEGMNLYNCISRENIKAVLYSLPLPLPTIPILIILVAITLFSMPFFLFDKKNKEFIIRSVCGATWKKIYIWISGIYIMHIVISIMPCIFLCILFQNHLSLIFFIIIIGLLEILFGEFYMIIKTKINYRGGYQKWKRLN